MATTVVEMPQELVEAIESGEITRDQVHQPFTVEAAMIGLTFDEAVEGARSDTLPRNAVGLDLRDLLYMLGDAELTLRGSNR